jgi:hypothetical protein
MLKRCLSFPVKLFFFVVHIKEMDEVCDHKIVHVIREALVHFQDQVFGSPDVKRDAELAVEIRS